MTDYTELKRLAEIMARDVDGDLSDAEARNFHQHLSDYEAATTPAAVLALIAENERIAKTSDAWERLSVYSKSISDSFWAERDQLKADNERLRADYAGLARFNPEWDRVAAAQDLVREHVAMVVQLKAEIAGLKTGYEAYERVNAELKAEVEGLRIANTFLLPDAQRHRWLRANGYDTGSFHRAHEHNAKAWFEYLNDSAIDAAIADESIDAALGQGEQS